MLATSVAVSPRAKSHRKCQRLRSTGSLVLRKRPSSSSMVRCGSSEICRAMLPFYNGATRHRITRQGGAWRQGKGCEPASAWLPSRCRKPVTRGQGAGLIGDNCLHSGEAGASLARRSLPPRPLSMPPRCYGGLISPSSMGENVCCAAGERTSSDCLHCLQRRAPCRARTMSSGELRPQRGCRWERQFQCALSSTADIKIAPGLNFPGLAGGDGGELNSTPPVR